MIITMMTMDVIEEGQDDESSLPIWSSNNSRGDEGSPFRDDSTASSDEMDVFNAKNNAGYVADGMVPPIQRLPSDHYHEYDDDGYPTDEQSIAQMMEEDLKRRDVLQLGPNRLEMTVGEESSEVPANSIQEDSSFLADVVIDDVDIADVEAGPDDATFLARADVEDVHVEETKSSHGNFLENPGDADSCYNQYASTLSRASASTKASTIGDAILKESRIAAQMTRNNANGNGNVNGNVDDQSASTYSYRRAYVDHVTLTSNYTSTCSALTDEYCFHARKTGMSEAIKGNGGGDDNFARQIKQSNSGPVDADTGTLMVVTSDKSFEESLARPPPPSPSNQSSDLIGYGNSDHITRVISFGGGDFGGGEGYVDEEAARKFSGTHHSGCCGYFVYSSRMVKLIVLCSAMLLLVSVVGVMFALMLPKDMDIKAESSAISSGVTATPVIPSTGADEHRGIGLAATKNSTDIMVPSVDSTTSSTPSDDTAVPSISPVGALKSSPVPTQVPSQAPESSFIFSTSELEPSASDPTSPPSTAMPTTNPTTDSPTEHPSMSPTLRPTIKPTGRPTWTPSQIPTVTPTGASTNEPTLQPQSVRPTPIPTEFPIATSQTAASSAPAQTPISTRTVTLHATQDTYVDQSSPFRSFQSSDRLRVDMSPRVWSFIEFDTSAIANIERQVPRNEPRQVLVNRVVNAKLRLYTLDEGGGGIFFSLPNAKQWSGNRLTWNKMDLVDTTAQTRVDSSNWFDAFRWYEMDVTDAFQGSGVTAAKSFLIKSYSTNGVEFASREYDSGEFSPELVLTLASDAGAGPLPSVHASLTDPPESTWPTCVPTGSPNGILTDQPSRVPTEYLSKAPMSSWTPFPTDDPTASLFANKSSKPNDVPDFVPPGCPTTSDINFAFKEALMSEDLRPSVHVFFPSQDSFVAGGTASGENHGKSSELVLDHYTSRVLLEFDHDLDAATDSLSSASLRLFVDNVVGTAWITIYQHTSEWREEDVTWEDFGTPPMAKAGSTFQVTSSDIGEWIDVDITDLVDSSQANTKLVLTMKDFSASGSSSECLFASRETCYSPKLVVYTDAI